MKMRRKESSQIRLPSQCAHDLRDGQCGKNALGLQTERQYIGEHFDQQSGIQTIALELHRAHMENRFHDRQVSYPREQFFEFMFLPSKVEVKYQPKKRRHCPP